MMASKYEVKIIAGSFKGMTGVLVRHVDESHVEVSVTLFGRSTNVRLRVEEIEDPFTDPRPRHVATIKQSVDRWWGHLQDRWWQDHEDSTWGEYTLWWTQAQAERDQIKANLLDQFVRAYPNARLDSLGVLGLGQTIQDSWDVWGKYQQMWQDLIAERKRRMKASPAYMKELSETHQRARERKNHAFLRDFEARHPRDKSALREYRDKALASALERYHKIKPEFEAAFGLRLPEQTARFWAFWTSLGELERQVTDIIWRNPVGLMDWFNPTFDTWTLRPGLDHRLHYRYRYAPPEFVCVMTGDSDGLNYGLIYDDPEQEPQHVGYFYARDDNMVSLCGATILEAYRLSLERFAQEVQHTSGQDETEGMEMMCRVDAVREALMHFETSDRPEEGKAYEDAYGAHCSGQMDQRIPTLDGLGVAALIDPMLPLDRPEDVMALYRIFKDEDAPEVPRWIEHAKEQLAQGNPWPALVLGRDLFYCDSVDAWQAPAVELLTLAYGMLGRDALAEIVKVHHAHRDLAHVGVYDES